VSLKTILVGVLVVQLGLVGLTWGVGGDKPASSEPLVGVVRDEVTGIQVWGSGEDASDSVALARNEGGWVLSSHGDYPASTEKVSKLLDGLLDAQVRDPIATQVVHHADLAVSDTEHDKKVEIQTAAGTQTLFVGSGSKDAHVRRGGETAVFVARGLSAWSIGTKESQYRDANALDLDASRFLVVQVQLTNGEGFTLERQSLEEPWTSPGLEGSLDLEAVQGWLDRVASLRITALPDDPSIPVTPITTFSWVLEEDGESVGGSLAIGAATDDKNHPVRAHDSKYTVLVNPFALGTAITDGSLEKLLAAVD
jgi:hypothetical protein